MKKLLSVFFLTSLLAGAAYADQHEKDGASTETGVDASVNVGDDVSVDTDANAGMDADMQADDHYHDHDGHMVDEGDMETDDEDAETYTD